MVFWRPRGCVLDLQFAELSGNKVYDLSGNGNHGTIYGAQWVKGPLLGSLYFDGVDDYVEVAYSPVFALNTWTFEALARAISSKEYNGIFGTRFGANYTFDLKFSYLRGLHGDIGNGTIWLTTTADYYPGIELNKWYHIVYVVQPNQCDIYLNGRHGTTVTYSGTPLLMNSLQSMRIGDSYKTEYGNIEVALVRIYNRALMEDEIKAHYRYLMGYVNRIHRRFKG